MKHVIITGGSRGIGAAAVRAFSARGDHAYRVGEVDWMFTVEGFNNEKPLIPTGQLNWPVAVFGALGVLLIAGGVVVLTKKKKHDEA